MSTETDTQAVRFHTEVQHIHRADLHAEEFPFRPLRPVKGRKPTMYATATHISSEEDVTSEASDASDYAKLRSIVEGSARDVPRSKVKADKSVASKLVNAMKVGTKARQNSDSDNSIKAAREVAIPTFADGLSLMQQKSEGNGKSFLNTNNDTALDKKKHTFARLVNAARHFRSYNGKIQLQNPNSVEVVEPWIKSRLLDLARSAKVRASTAIGNAEVHNSIRQKRENIPSWDCADVDHATLLEEESPMASLIPESVPLKSLLTVHKISLRELREAYKRDGDHPTSVKAKQSRSNIGENRLRFVDSNDEVIWIGRDGQVVEQASLESEKGHHRREVGGRDRHHHHHHHHHSHHAQHTCSRTHSHSLEEQRHRYHSPDKIRSHQKRPVVTFEEHARLEQAYGEAMKREAKSHLVHDAISLGGSTW